MQHSTFQAKEICESQWSGREDSNLRPPAPKKSVRLPWFFVNSFLSWLLHGFGASAFARNAYSLARLMDEFLDGFLTVAVTAIFYWLRSLLSSAIQSSRYQRLNVWITGQAYSVD